MLPCAVSLAMPGREPLSHCISTSLLMRGGVVWAPFAQTFRKAEVFTGTMEQERDVRRTARQMGGLSRRWVSGATGSAQQVPGSPHCGQAHRAPGTDGCERDRYRG